MPLPVVINVSGEGVNIPRFNPFFTKLEEIRVLAQDAFDNAWLALSLIKAGGAGGSSGSTVRVFNSVADAVAFNYTSPQPQLIFTTGTSAYGDGGAGFWLYDPTSISAINTYDCIATINSPGRLLKQL